MKDGDETDIDCGGKTCPHCPLGKACVDNSDCADSTCENKICALCHDGKTNGTETDVDCGGTACGKCSVGKACLDPKDCKSESCGTDKSCACPVNMHEISLAGVPGTTATAYCIDKTEVSKGQYDAFIKANIAVTTQTAPCLGNNLTFAPRGGTAWPPAAQPPAQQGLAYNYGLPVHYVNWCQATAYCKWAKKELCGLVGGGAVPVAQGTDATKSAWYNACSQNGTKTFPYGGSTYDPARCNGNGLTSAATTAPEGPNPSGGFPGDRNLGFGYAVNSDQGLYDVVVSDMTGVISNPAHISCQGGQTDVYQMSGNVAEWENSCDDNTATGNCRVRGGSYLSADNSGDLACTSARAVQRMPPVTTPDPLADIGIRCCQY